jgi:hypothetical protein
MIARFWKRLILGIVLFVIVAAAGLLALFKIVQHRIASRLAPPVLERESTSAPDLPYRTLDGASRRVSVKRQGGFSGSLGHVVRSVRGGNADRSETI